MVAIVEPEYLETGAFARGLDVAVETVRGWERQGKITPFARTSTGRRLFSREQLEEVRAQRSAQHELDAPVDAA